MRKLILLFAFLSACQSQTAVQKNEAPTVRAESFLIPEKSLAVGRVQVSDPNGDPYTLSLSGTDAALFSISSTSDLTFKEMPNFELPKDADKDGVYDLTVTASDGSLTAAAPVKVTVTDVNELPPGLATASITTNTASSRLADFEANNGTRFTLSGERNSAGLPSAITAVQVQNIQSTHDQYKGKSALAATDTGGRIRELYHEGGARVQFSYREDGKIGSIAIILADGSEQSVLSVDYSATAESALAAKKARTPAPRRQGKVSVSKWSKAEECAHLGIALKPSQQAPVGALARTVTSANTSEATVTVQECGNAIAGARVFFVRADGALAPTYMASDVGGGVYKANIPLASGIGPDIEAHCAAFIETASSICSAISDSGGFNPTIVAGLAANCLRFLNPLAVAACEASLGVVVTYCEFGAPISDLVADSFCESVRDNLDLPSEEMVTYYAVAYLPSGGRAESGRVTVRRIDPVPPMYIESGAILGPAIISFVQPEDPSPLQGYTVRVGVSCRANADQVSVSVVGTDGYTDSAICALTNKQGGCTLAVPGGEAGVVDRITIVAGNEQRSLTVIF